MDAATLAQLRSGKLRIRQTPGPKNSLGLVKFLFPNEYDVYLHDTPATELFSRFAAGFQSRMRSRGEAPGTGGVDSSGAT